MGEFEYTLGQYSLADFVAVMKKFNPFPLQPWKDKSGYMIVPELEKIGKMFHIQIWFYEDYVGVSPQGYGSIQALRAVSPEELENQIKAWMLNREIIT
ncbi:MAG: hypothetical protein ACI8ZM_002489 [Crocinitomix sp.]|jgi:hypothetical protein